MSMTFELSVPSFLILAIMFMSNFSWQKTLRRKNNAVKVKNSFLILYGLRKGRYNHFQFCKISNAFGTCYVARIMSLFDVRCVADADALVSIPTFIVGTCASVILLIKFLKFICL